VGADGLRFVCMSDLHLGAQNSVLSAIQDDGITVDAGRTSDVLSLLFAGLRRLVEQLAPGEARPTLVLNGDILEFALATDDTALTAFERFMDLAFPADGTPIFDDRVLYLPGNHDHHLWETARERQYARYVQDLAPTDALASPWHVTPMLNPDASVEAEVLTAILRRRPHRETVSVAVVYPNLGFVDPASNRAVIFHHGHFTEPLYRLMSTLQHALFPEQELGPHIWDWESDNFAWIDFFWSALGRSGVVGADVGALYTMLQSPEALKWLARNLSTAATDEHGPTWSKPVTTPALRRLLTFAVDRAAPLERAHITEPLSPRASAGLDEYLAGPLLRQLVLEDQAPTSSPPSSPASSPASSAGSDRALTFVFGHTHKPFEAVRRVTGWTQPIRILNTGGWVVDTVDPVAVQGAAIVLVAHDGTAVSLRLFTEQDSGPVSEVCVTEPHLAPGADQGAGAGDVSAWCERVRDAVGSDAQGWAAFSGAVEVAVAQRHQAITKIIDRAMSPRP
jgi:UDP-2,3-diacylglucosamine pyrophosphatase LpxH